MKSWCFALILSLCGCAVGHVSLTYPVPRHVNYNFLDNARTPSPCGGQLKASPLSEFREGSNITVSWELAYAHRGGYRIELLPHDNLTDVIKLVPTNDDLYTGADDTTATSVNVTLPAGFTCDNCTMRLIRQAAEWSGPPEGYLFWSCADVRIINRLSEYCSNHGSFSNGECTCNKLYTGDRCQFWNECDENSDCQNGGICKDTYAVSSPRKQCFCAQGYFGKECAKVSSVKTLNNLDLSKHIENEFSKDFKLYHRLVGTDEIEMVLKAKTETWLGFGWKPQGELQCENPDHMYTGEGEGEGEAESEAEKEAKATAENNANATAEDHEYGNSTDGSALAENASAEAEEIGSNSNATTGSVVITTNEDYLLSQGLSVEYSTYNCTPGSVTGEAEAEGEAKKETEEGAKAEGVKNFTVDENNYVKWSYNNNTDVVIFTIVAEVSNGDWVAVGLSNNKRMASTSVLFVGVTSQGVAEFSKRWAADYSIPLPDSTGADTFNSSLNLTDGVLTAVVYHPAVGNGVNDITLDECRFVIFGKGQGYSSTSSFSKHVSTPIVSTEKLCFKKKHYAVEGAAEEGAAEEGAAGEGAAEEDADGGHPMDCTDMVLASAVGEYSRIHDSFSRDRSTPKFDTFFNGGENNFIAAIGKEENGETTILIRRKLVASDARDHSIADASMAVIWAFGQQHLKYVHDPPTGLEQCQAKEIFFYRKDVPMYHGRVGQRGAQALNFLAAPQEPNANKFMRDQNNHVSWTYNAAADSITFIFTAELSIGQWVAMGLSDDKKMANTDVLHIGMNADGQPEFSDRYATIYDLPAIDSSESDTEASMVVNNGVLTATIQRALDTKSDDDTSLTECKYMFIVNGAGYTDAATRFNKHATASLTISSEKQCFKTRNSSSKSVAILPTLTLLVLSTVSFVFV